MTPYYSEPGIDLYCGDNAAMMADMASDSVDLTVTSPPYDNLRRYLLPDGTSPSWDFPAIARELTRLTKPGGVIVWVVADATVDGSETGTSMRQALHFKDVCGLNLHDTMIFQQDRPPLTHRRYEQSFEFMFVISKGPPRTFNPIRSDYGIGTIERMVYDKTSTMMRTQNGQKDVRTLSGLNPDGRINGNVWKYRVGFGAHEDVFDHPAPFPEALARDHILSWSNPGDVVLDPFAGSSTTLKMAKLNGRRAVGIEINPEYCEISKRRLVQGVLFSAPPASGPPALRDVPQCELFSTDTEDCESRR